MTSSENRRKTGDKFEKEVLVKLGDSFSKTAGSGSVFKDGDLRHHSLVAECKVKNSTQSFCMTKTEMNHLLKQAYLQGKDWLFIEKNGRGQILVLTELDTLIELVEGTIKL